MRKLKSPNSFKTSYIADVKEELGFLKNKKVKSRKIKAPSYLKPYIIRAIKELGKKATYKDIQKRAFEIYQMENLKKIDKYYGIFKLEDESFINNIALDKEIYYEDN